MPFLIFAHGGGGKITPEGSLVFACACFLMAIIPLVASIHPKWREKMRMGRHGKRRPASFITLAAWVICGLVWGGISLLGGFFEWPFVKEHSKLLYLIGFAVLLLSRIYDGFRLKNRNKEDNS
ncbi:MAG: hypothetical protein IT426_06885 [Pirellulales bacterium]|nr:hypothetical protein [Pirellulales bacterium]